MNDSRKRALGRGLEQLFNTENLDINNFEKQIYENSTNEEIININLSELRVNPYQPRKNFDEEALQELSNSIKEHGVFQPIIVKKSIKGYEIIAGERRFRASKMAGKETIPAIVREFTDAQMMEIALLENLQRENLSAIEEAIAYKAMLEKLELTQEELGNILGATLAKIGCVVNPEVFVIGGGVSKAGAILINTIQDHYKETAFYASKDTRFELATLGNDAGIYGCMAMLL